MIVNVSGRTDIVAFYMPWFLKRLDEGFFLVRNPFYRKLVHRIEVRDIDMFVFCTKNPQNLIDNIEKIHKPFIVHVTLTPYGKDIEPGVPDKKEVISSIKELSKKIGEDRIFVRYDPIFLSEKYDIDYHKRAFSTICHELAGYIDGIIISFLDEYKNVLENKDILGYREFNRKDYEEIGLSFSNSAIENGLTVQTCAEEETLFEYGFIQRDCITEDLVYKYAGVSLNEKWTARKGKCNCIKMYDIGDYNSCKHYCKYCYANYNSRDIEKNVNNHDDDSSLLIGCLKPDDEIKLIKPTKGK